MNDSSSLPLFRFAENTGFKGPIYADPDRALYRALDMKENMKGTPAGEKKRGYLQDSIVQNVVGAFKVGRTPAPRPLSLN